MILSADDSRKRGHVRGAKQKVICQRGDGGFNSFGLNTEGGQYFEQRAQAFLGDRAKKNADLIALLSKRQKVVVNFFAPKWNIPFDLIIQNFLQIGLGSLG